MQLSKGERLVVVRQCQLFLYHTARAAENIKIETNYTRSRTKQFGGKPAHPQPEVKSAQLCYLFTGIRVVVNLGQKVHDRSRCSHLIRAWIAKAFAGVIPRGTLDVHTVDKHAIGRMAGRVLGTVRGVRRRRGRGGVDVTLTAGRS